MRTNLQVLLKNLHISHSFPLAPYLYSFVCIYSIVYLEIVCLFGLKWILHFSLECESNQSIALHVNTLHLLTRYFLYFSLYRIFLHIFVYILFLRC